MPRSISVDRRRPNLVDLTVARRAGVRGYRFYAATNWDASFTAFQDVMNDGFRSVSVPDSSYGVGRFNHVARFLFNPADYTTGVPAVVDNAPVYVRLAPISDAGVVGSQEAIHVILPYNSAPNRPFVMQGTVPQGANLTASLEVQLPMSCNDFDFSNDGAADLFVAFERPGGEYRVQPASTAFKSFEQTFTAVNQIFMRGSGGTTIVSIAFTIRNNPF